ncbi:MAG: DUF3822 family protein [Bacteroidota bacterium]
MLGQYYKEKLILIDKTNFKSDEACSLSLFISQSFFIFSISSQNYANLLQLCHIEFTNLANGETLTEKITFLLNNYQLPQKKFQKITISVLNKDFTILPEAYSNPNDLKEFLTFSSGLAEVKNVKAQSIKNVKFCYAIDEELIQYLEKTFTRAMIKHSGTINLDLFFSNHSLIKSNLFLSINDGLIEIAAKENNELLFYNVFNYDNNEDVLYYILFMMEQFNLNSLQTKLSISGQIKTNDALILSIKKYIKHVNFVAHDPSLKLEGEFSELPSHFYFTLLNQHLCAL